MARLALIGDRRQLRAVEAGQPFGLLQDAGMPTARMDEVVRQRDADLRAAVLHMVADEPRMAVEELGNGVLETDSDELGRKAAQLWLDLDPSLRAGTAILAPTHELRAEINDAVRQGLEDEGVLRGPELEIERYVNLRLTRSQTGEAANYRPGDMAVFHHDVYGVKARAGDACRVLEARDDGRVVLAHPDGRERRIDPSGYIRYRLDLYETTPMVLRAADRVRWTRKDPARGLVNGEHAELLSIGPANLRMRTQDGREIAMRRDDPQRASRTICRILASTRKASALRMRVSTASSDTAAAVRSAIPATPSSRRRCSASSSTSRGGFGASVVGSTVSPHSTM